MKLYPRTLLARLLLLIALLLAVGQLATLKLFEYFERETRASAAALQVITVVNYTRAAILASHEDKRLALLTELTGRDGVRVYPTDLLEEIEPLPNEPFIKLVASKIRAALGQQTLVVINHFDIPGLWVTFHIGPDDFWLVIPRLQEERKLPWDWVGWGLLLIGLSLLGAYVIASRINQPLSLLAEAARRISKGETAYKLPIEGVEEIREVSRTFNEMNDALSRLDEERKLLLAGVSHDLRTPLARIRIATEMIPDQTCDQLKQGMIQDVVDMDNIIHQFLDFVRGVEGETTKMVNLNAHLQASAERQARVGRELKLQLSNNHLVNVRPLAIQRLLDNLIENAFKYGNGKVIAKTVVTANHIVLSILDNGPGIPQEQMSRLLRPFERLETARTAASGSGLGLAIVNRISQLHGSQLELINRPEGGLEARVKLPL